MCPTVLKSGNLSLLELSGPVQACDGIASPLIIIIINGITTKKMIKNETNKEERR
jgi:hypothetical protein